jgi:hypothetical protein
MAEILYFGSNAICKSVNPMCLSIVIVAELSAFETSAAVTLLTISKADFTFASQLEQVIPVI